MSSSKLTNRYETLDVIRGIAVLLMVYFHLFYDLTLMRLTQIDFRHNMFWFSLPRIIVTLFLFAVGISLYLVHGKTFHQKKFFSRWSKIAVGAIAISLVTYYLFPSRWVYFGTLHCIATTSLMAIPFLNRPKLSLGLGIVICFVGFGLEVKMPWWHLNHPAMDYIPALPWVGIVLIGVGIGPYQFWRKTPPLPKSTQAIWSFLVTLGRHALGIYILHQPILYGLAYALHKIL